MAAKLNRPLYTVACHDDLTAILIKDGFDPIEACKAALVEPLTDEPETINGLMEVVKASLDLSQGTIYRHKI